MIGRGAEAAPQHLRKTRLGTRTWTWTRVPQFVGHDLAAEGEAVWGDEADGLAPEPLGR